MREKWGELYAKQKNNIFYWASLILLVDFGISVYTALKFTHTGMCRNYLEIGSQLHSCTLSEFMVNGFRWISLSTASLFIPAAIIMIIGTYLVDQVFVKKE